MNNGARIGRTPRAPSKSEVITIIRVKQFPYIHKKIFIKYFEKNLLTNRRVCDIIDTPKHERRIIHEIS